MRFERLERLELQRGTQRLSYYDAERGAVPVLFQHGLCGSAEQTAEAFPDDNVLRLLTLECRGHGASPAPSPNDISIACFADDVIALIESLRVAPVILGGISMGAAIATRIAVRRPDLVRALILVRPAWITDAAPANMRPNAEVGELLATTEPDRARTLFEQGSTARRLAAEAPDNLASLRGFFERQPQAVTAELLRRISADGPGVTPDEVRALTVPALVVGHEADAIHPFAHARSLAALLKRSELAEITPKQLPAAKHDKEGRRLAVAATFVDSLPRDLQQQNPSAAAVYAVETLNTNGRSAGPSNQVAIPLAPVPEPPKDLSARVTPEGVVLSFSPTFKPDDTHHLGSAPAGTNVMVSNYVVYRGAKDARSFIAIGNAKESGNGKLTFEDNSADWESAHSYKVTPVTRTPSGAQVEGEDSPPIEVFTHDVFPPSAPAGLQAVSSGTAAEKFIDLTWAPNTESDLAGYNLYRRENVSPPVRINTELITTPAFRDRNVASGKKYTYSVTAVDLRKNESSPSPEASEVVP